MTKRSFLPSAPNKGIWIVAIIIGGLGILAHYLPIDAISKYNYEMLLIGFILLVVGTMFRNV